MSQTLAVVKELYRASCGQRQQITQAEGDFERLSATADGKRLDLVRTNEPVEAFIAKFDAQSHQFQEPAA
jgi:hypothetical protein